MFSPSEGMKEISHQLHTGAAQELIHYCNSLGQGVLHELGSSEQELVSQREAEHYVVKMDQSAQSRIDKLIQEAQTNSYTLYILVHDHAHWDISRFPKLHSSVIRTTIWLKIQDAEWVPHTYLDLEALPCILILSGGEPLGESLPRLMEVDIYDEEDIHCSQYTCGRNQLSLPT
ncbi:hypothetical protein XENOCAPTIV_028799 [Xenoophorus captivus]|uniref:GREB1-like circularly permuted SF2 helicase domain-containing protein n=1 Tax=Xenoophorus captivus TaxID=1517983 RepID=A0ABV0QUE2_9TELE